MTWRQRLLRLATFSPGVLRKSVCVRPRLPARRFQGCKEQIWQLPPPRPQVLGMFATSHPGCVFPHRGITAGEGDGQNVPLPTPFSNTDVVGGGGREGMAGEAIGRVTAWEIGGQPLKV